MYWTFYYDGNRNATVCGANLDGSEYSVIAVRDDKILATVIDVDPYHGYVALLI